MTVCGQYVAFGVRSVGTRLGQLTFVLVLLALLGYFALGPPDRLDTGDKLASIGALVFAAVAVVLRMNSVRGEVVDGGPHDRLAAELAGLGSGWAHSSKTTPTASRPAR
jgi:hypothetical protein